MRRTTLALVGLALLTTSASAEPIDTRVVPATSKWVVHVDFDLARKTDFAAAIRDRKELHQRITKGFGWLEERYGIARGDLHGMTMYGNTYEEEPQGVAILTADYELKKVERIIQDEPGYTTSKHGEFTFHTWSARDKHGSREDHGAAVDEASKAKDDVDRKATRDDRDEGEEAADTADNESQKVRESSEDLADAIDADDNHRHKVSAVFLERRIIMGSSEQLVQTALDRLSADSDHPRNSETVLGATIPEGVVFFAAATHLTDVSKDDFDLKLLHDIRQVSFSGGEIDGRVYLMLWMQTNDEEITSHLRDVAEGFRAFAHLAVREAVAQGEELPFDDDFWKLLTLGVDQSGEKLALKWNADVDEVIEAFDDVSKEYFDKRSAKKPTVEAREDIEVDESADPPQPELPRGADENDRQRERTKKDESVD